MTLIQFVCPKCSLAFTAVGDAEAFSVTADDTQNARLCAHAAERRGMPVTCPEIENRLGELRTRFLSL